jgi:hypothetical protein
VVVYRSRLSDLLPFAVMVGASGCSAPFAADVRPYESTPVTVSGPVTLGAKATLFSAASGEFWFAMVSVTFTNHGDSPGSVSFGHCSFGVSVLEGLRPVFSDSPPLPPDCPWGSVTVDVPAGSTIDRQVFGIFDEVLRPGGGPRTYRFAIHLLVTGESRVRRLEAGTLFY